MKTTQCEMICMDCQKRFSIAADCRAYACPHCGGKYDEDGATASERATRIVGSIEVEHAPPLNAKDVKTFENEIEQLGYKIESNIPFLRLAKLARGPGVIEIEHAPNLEAATNARQVIRDRLADWSRRSDKWHGILDTARKWVAFGDKAPTVIASAVALVAWQWSAHVAVYPLVGAVLSALIGWKVRAARSDLDDAHTEQVWLIADRVSEFYRGLVCRFGVDPDLDLLRESQEVESTARIGLPKEVQDSIARTVRSA